MPVSSKGKTSARLAENECSRLLICLRRQWHPVLFFDPATGYTMSMKIPGYIASYKTGSNYTVTPPVTTTDVDYLVLVKDIKEAMDWLLADGYSLCEHQYAQDVETGATVQWFAVRKGVLNLIVQANVSLYFRSCAATELCRALNVKNKEDRIAIFRAVKFGVESVEGDVEAPWAINLYPPTPKRLIPNVKFDD